MIKCHLAICLNFAIERKGKCLTWVAPWLWVNKYKGTQAKERNNSNESKVTSMIELWRVRVWLEILMSPRRENYNKNTTWSRLRQCYTSVCLSPNTPCALISFAAAFSENTFICALERFDSPLGYETRQSFTHDCSLNPVILVTEKMRSLGCRLVFVYFQK